MSLRPVLKRPYAVVLALVALVVGLVGTAPAQASVTTNPNATTWRVLVGEQSPDLAIQGMRFLPGEIWIDQGDSIKFLANAAEVHTVSFGTPPTPIRGIGDLLADAVPRVGGPVFDPTAPWTNSGILTTMPVPDFPTSTSYLQKFAARGDFTFFCLFHGEVMTLTVHVQAPNAAYPHTQAFYDAQAAAETAGIVAHGYGLWAATAAQATPTHVFVGAADGLTEVMRFIWQDDVVHLGQTVTFDLSADHMVVPHTVTFTTLMQHGMPVDSGTLLEAFVGGPSTFSVTFDQLGIWNYFCEFHDDMGMVGSVTVVP
ncbi:plastocyanin/azurin family copper-binding protein [Sinomonas sp. ASV322]|uniref:cupredoxin domain-containing protein n=1 Tax=Sinomonas sp. ASV322 TaxID=3041920 RepID=UPI0027DE8939|nr:plastocyanin/azurin family copper-binding protein [Sinomonas sp. ASV322]MDQ4503816.1 plastocyanin/azurin family copper-binding protein [Sinomonas sp. ASV322]